MNHGSCYVVCYLVTFGNTTEHEYDHDSEFEFDDGDDWLEIENTKKNADDNDTRAGDRDDKNI